MAARKDANNEPLIDYGDGQIHVAQTAYNRGIMDGRLGTGNTDHLSKIAPEVLHEYLEGYKFAEKRNEERGYTGAEADQDPGVITRSRRKPS